MQRLWGRKISDLAFGEFLQILKWVATKKGKQVIFIDQWYPSSKTCFHCGHVLESLESHDFSEAESWEYVKATTISAMTSSPTTRSPE